VAAQRALATALTHTDDLKGAETAWRALAELQPAAADPHVQLGRVLERQRRDLAARDEYETAQRLEPANADALQALERLKAPVGAASSSPPATPLAATPTTPAEPPAVPTQ
jgi:cytochrome c-type biogenesis protein CcmH/NrfG